MEAKKVVRRSRVGRVIGDKSSKTVKVLIEGMHQHPKYKKYIRREKTFLAHDPQEVCKVGDLVRIEECRPISKLKKWVVREIVEKAGKAASEIVKEAGDDSAGINP